MEGLNRPYQMNDFVLANGGSPDACENFKVMSGLDIPYDYWAEVYGFPCIQTDFIENSDKPYLDPELGCKKFILTVKMWLRVTRYVIDKNTFLSGRLVQFVRGNFPIQVKQEELMYYNNKLYIKKA